ncbi:hypothetical protein FACS1894152_7730 [Bacilli bacterium]|nr:hypothetical protein FACS1894152_7730 [Bacilli bacterium]
MRIIDFKSLFILSLALGFAMNGANAGSIQDAWKGLSSCSSEQLQLQSFQENMMRMEGMMDLEDFNVGVMCESRPKNCEFYKKDAAKSKKRLQKEFEVDNFQCTLPEDREEL